MIVTVFNRLAEGFDTAYPKEAKRLLDASALRRHWNFTSRCAPRRRRFKL
jgi:hypothetical protein